MTGGWDARLQAESTEVAHKSQVEVPGILGNSLYPKSPDPKTVETLDHPPNDRGLKTGSNLTPC